MLPFFISISGIIMFEQIDLIKEEFKKAVSYVKYFKNLEDIRIRFLGRKGKISAAFQLLSEIPKDKRPEFGKRLNELKNYAEKEYDLLKSKFNIKDEIISGIDLTLPGRKPFIGKKHPLIQIADEIKSVFIQLGFAIEDGPEIETDYYNFEALNIPPNHPARDMQDTL